MADLEFFFDAVVPVGVDHVPLGVRRSSEQRSYEIEWRFISLKMINEDLSAEWYTPQLQGRHTWPAVCAPCGRRGALAARQRGRGCAGTQPPVWRSTQHQRRPTSTSIRWPVMAEMSGTAGLPVGLADQADERDPRCPRPRRHRAGLRAAPASDAGTPIITFNPGQPNEGSFFGLVISEAPLGAEADAAVGRDRAIATTTGVAELKRSNRSARLHLSLRLRPCATDARRKDLGRHDQKAPGARAAPSHPSLSPHRPAQRVVARGHRGGIHQDRRRAPVAGRASRPSTSIPR